MIPGRFCIVSSIGFAIHNAVLYLGLLCSLPNTASWFLGSQTAILITFLLHHHVTWRGRRENITPKMLVQYELGFAVTVGIQFTLYFILLDMFIPLVANSLAILVAAIWTYLFNNFLTWGWRSPQRNEK